jgi:hypothetical protein
MGYFIENEDTESNFEQQFYKCSILMRRVCSDQFATTFKQHDSIAHNSQVEYFKGLVNHCIKFNKNKIKKAIKTDINNEFINHFQIEFLKSFIHNATKLANVYSLKVDCLKICRQLVSLYISLDENDDFNHRNEGNIDLLVRTIIFTINSLHIDQFQLLIQHFDDLIFDNEKYSTSQIEMEKGEEEQLKQLQSYLNVLKKLSSLLKHASIDYEIKAEFKPLFTVFIQKYLLQIQPFYFQLLEINNNNNSLIQLLDTQASIFASKYFILPSHIVITSLQFYISLNYNEFNLNDYVQMQGLVCKTINNLLTRYSRKFSRIAPIICSLIIKLISTTTGLSNQTNIKTDQDFELSLKAAEDVERLVTQLIHFKVEFSKIIPYMISEFTASAHSIPIEPTIKNVLWSIVYNLISICDIHAIAQLHVILPTGSKDIFKNIYADYEKYFKYTGKV